MGLRLGYWLSCVVTIASLPVTASAEAVRREFNWQWSEIAPGEGTVCARGQPYSFFVSQIGDPERLVLDFAGGGACWDASSCAPGSNTFFDTVQVARNNLQAPPAGIYDHHDSRNPVRGWTHVVVPYCTGDVHWGDSAVTYRQTFGQAFTIQHRGARNAQATIAWIKKSLPNLKQILVAGCSAGAYGSVYWTPAVKKLYPEATVSQFADSGVGVLTDKFKSAAFPLWNVTAHAPVWVPGLDPRTEDYTRLRVIEFYLRIAAFYPDVNFSQFTHAYDRVQSFFYLRMGGNIFAWHNRMKDYVHEIYNGASKGNFAYFVGEGSNHCVMGTDEFYSAEVNGSSLVEWLGKVINSRKPRTEVVACTDCGEADIDGIYAMQKEAEQAVASPQ